ncbi:hypothetical protein Tco_0238321 [Tanacetum coccineum]
MILSQHTSPAAAPKIDIHLFRDLTVIENYLGPKIGDDLQKVLQRYTADLIQKYYVKPALEPIKIQTSTTDLEPESEKSASKIHNIKNEQAEKQKMAKYTNLRLMKGGTQRV